jgi:hypothetical protein
MIFKFFRVLSVICQRCSVSFFNIAPDSKKKMAGFVKHKTFFSFWGSGGLTGMQKDQMPVVHEVIELSLFDLLFAVSPGVVRHLCFF